jgi:hypothetical protein
MLRIVPTHERESSTSRLERPRLRQRGRRRGMKNAAQIKRDVEVESGN